MTSQTWILKPLPLTYPDYETWFSEMFFAGGTLTPRTENSKAAIGNYVNSKPYEPGQNRPPLV